MPNDELETDEPQSTEGMGISSERLGPVGHGVRATTGKRDASRVPPPEDPAPEQSTGGPEEKPGGLAPKADPPSIHPTYGDQA